MLELKEGNHYICLAFASWNDGDWLAGAWREEETGKAHLVYRFRDSVATMNLYNWYVAEGAPTELSNTKIIKMIETMLGFAIVGRGATVADLILIDGGVGAVIRALSQAPWAHLKKVRRIYDN